MELHHLATVEFSSSYFGTAPNHARKTITANSLYVGYNTAFTFLSTDRVGYLGLANGGNVTVTSTANVSGSIDVGLTPSYNTNGLFYDSGGNTLTLNQALNLSGYLNVQNSSTLNFNNNSITANRILLGWNGTTPVNIQDQGTINTSGLYLGNGMTYNFKPNDSIGYLALENNAAATTNASAPNAGNLTGSVDIFTGSTLNLNQALNLSGYLNVQDAGSTLNANGNAISANQIYLGWNGNSPVNLLGQPTISANSLYIGNGMTYNFNQADAVGYLGLNNASAITGAAGNVTGSVDLLNGCTLNLGANMNLSGAYPSSSVYGVLNVQDGSTLNFNGNTINANQVMLGWNGSSPVTVNNQGATLTANSLLVGNGTYFNFQYSDSVNYLATAGAGTVVSTTSFSNVSGSVDVLSGSTLNVNSGMALQGFNPNTGLYASLNVQDGSTLNMAGAYVYASNVFYGYNGSSAVTIENQGGALNAYDLSVGNGTNYNFQPLDSVSNFTLSGGATATTVATGNISGSVLVDGAGSVLTLGANLYVSGTVSETNGGQIIEGNYGIGAPEADIAGISLKLGAHDQIGTLNLSAGAMVSTSSGTSISGPVSVDGAGTTLTLGAALTLGSGSISLTNGGTLDAAGMPISAYSLAIGYTGSSAASLMHAGSLTLTNLMMGNGSQLTLSSGSTTVSNQVFPVRYWDDAHGQPSQRQYGAAHRGRDLFRRPGLRPGPDAHPRLWPKLGQRLDLPLARPCGRQLDQPDQ